MAKVVVGHKNKVSVTITRPANTTAYTAKDAINQAALTVSGATNATPIVMTTGAHGLVDGDVVTQASVGGNTNANGTFFVDVLSTVTYALYSDKALTTPVAGNANYTSGGTAQPLVRLKNLVWSEGVKAYIVKARLWTNLVTFLDQVKVHLYNTPVASIADNAAFTLLAAKQPYREGSLDFAALATEASGSDCSEAILTNGNGNVPLTIQAAADNRDFYAMVEDLGTGTPASGQTFTLELTVEED